MAFFFIALLLLSGCGSGARGLTKTYSSPEEMFAAAEKEYLAHRYEDAENTFKGLLERYPLSEYSLKAEVLLGDVAFAGEKYDDARAYYTNFVALHPSHPKAPYALFQKGMCYFKDVLTLDREQISTRKALFVFQDLTEQYPGSPYYAKSKELITFLKRRLAESEFYIGRFYFKNKNYKGALSRFREILRLYPSTGITAETLYYIGESYTRLGEKKLARDTFTTLLKDYPESPFTKSAKKRLDG